MKKIKEKAEGSVNHHGLRFLKKEKILAIGIQEQNKI
jgi:hypothetical protein